MARTTSSVFSLGFVGITRLRPGWGRSGGIFFGMGGFSCPGLGFPVGFGGWNGGGVAAPGPEVSDPQGSHPSRGKGGREGLRVRKNHIRKSKAFTGAKSGWLQREQREQRGRDGSRLPPRGGDIPMFHRDEQLGCRKGFPWMIFPAGIWGMLPFPPHSHSTRRSQEPGAASRGPWSPSPKPGK